jgi:hypothetical protein
LCVGGDNLKVSDQSPPPGWYPDPVEGGSRWWDGRGWTHFHQTVSETFNGGAVVPRRRLGQVQVGRPFAQLIVTDSEIVLKNRLNASRPLEVFRPDDVEFAIAVKSRGQWLSFRRVGEPAWSRFAPNGPMAALEAALERTQAHRVESNRVEFRNVNPFTLTTALAWTGMGVAALVLTTYYPAPVDHLLARFRGVDQPYNAGSFVLHLLGATATVTGTVMLVVLAIHRRRSVLRDRGA